MMRKEISIVTIACVILLLITCFIGTVYFFYINFGGFELVRPIRDIDEVERRSRPYKYVDYISDSNISIVYDLYSPKFFDNDSITVFFPEGTGATGMISYGPDDPDGSAVISDMNGSELSSVTWTGDGSGIGGGGFGARYFQGGEYLNLNFTGSGIVIFYSASTSEMFEGSSDHSSAVGKGLVTFYIPLDLTRTLPWDERIIAWASPENGCFFHVKYYCDYLRLLAEEKGTGSVKTQIPSGSSGFIFAVVESEGNVTFRFSHSPPAFWVWRSTGTLLLSLFILSTVSFIVLTVYAVLARKTKKAGYFR